MNVPNTQFELSVNDIDVIETALRRQIRALTEHRMTYVQSTIKPESELASVQEIDREVREIHTLLGRLHNQKEWYRPKDNYIGG